MDFLVPLMPLLGALPFSVAMIVVARMWFGSRGRVAEFEEELALLREEVAALRSGQVEAQERLDFAERVLTRVKALEAAVESR